jgi:hypothetical protein
MDPPMPMPSTAMINGSRYSHSSIRARLYGQLFKGLKEIAWKVAVEKADVMGTARESIAKTAGTVKYEASCVVYRAEWDYLKEIGNVQRGRPIMDCEGDVVISYSERGQPSKSVHIRIAGITEADTTSSAGSDATEVKLTFSVIYIKENGLALVENGIY